MPAVADSGVMAYISAYLRGAVPHMRPLFHAFLLVLAWRPHRAIEVAYWYLTKRKVRARNRLRVAVADAPFAYHVLIRSIERQAQVIAEAPDLVAGWRRKPTFSILVIASKEEAEDWLDAAIRSVEQQCYDHWEMLLVGEGVTKKAWRDPRVRWLPSSEIGQAELLNIAIGAARGDFVVPLTFGTLLSPLALFRFGEALQAAPDTRVLYGDQDSIAGQKRSGPWLKPDWNGEMILALDFASRACVIAADIARAVPSSAPMASDCPVYALLLAVTRCEATEPVHVRHITAHIQIGSERADTPARALAVTAQFAAEGAEAKAGQFGTVTVRWPMPSPEPSVTIFVPTRDKVELVETCVGSLLAKTRYENYTIAIIDNGSVEPATLKYFDEASRDPRVSVLSCPIPYNFSAINNFAVEQTGGDYLCFLNNDTEIIDGEWLVELMRYAVRPGIGAVGAKLLYEDRSIQHAGVVIGLGNAAGHAHRALPEGDPGYFAQAHVAHFASAVTAACMVVERRKFLKIGGFDAEHLQIAYNDVDLCLKLGQAGWRNVYAPQAVLLHLETKSRGSDFSSVHVERYMRELAVLQDRWDTTSLVDPMHHPGLDRSSETYRIAF